MHTLIKTWDQHTLFISNTRKS